MFLVVPYNPFYFCEVNNDVPTSLLSLVGDFSHVCQSNSRSANFVHLFQELTLCLLFLSTVSLFSTLLVNDLYYFLLHLLWA